MSARVKGLKKKKKEKKKEKEGGAPLYLMNAVPCERCAMEVSGHNLLCPAAGRKAGDHRRESVSR